VAFVEPRRTAFQARCAVGRVAATEAGATLYSAGVRILHAWDG
jgi:hypothetical protein